MTSRTRRAIALPASAAALATAALAMQALIAAPARSAAVHQPARGTGWRVDKTISVHDGSVILDGLDAVSARDAWVAGVVVSGYGSRFGLLLEHWDGAAWRRVALPAKLARHFTGPVLHDFVGASSASNVWAFSTDGKYLRRIGDRWTFGRLPGSRTGQTFVESAKVFSRTDVWVFGGRGRGFEPFAARFDGRRWTVVSVPGNGALDPVSAIGPRNMWAITGGELPVLTSPPSRVSIVHWDGVAWRKVAKQLKVSRRTLLTGILARTSNDVWVGGGTHHNRPGSSEVAWHWNGTAWTSRSPHTAATGQHYFLSSLVPAPDGMWALGENLGGAARVWRYAGAWSAPVRLPWDLFQLAAVPHSGSVWAIGLTAGGDGGLIVLHGPVPR